MSKLKTDPSYRKELLSLLKKHYPNAKIVLKYSNNFELLVAVILSAQCTDKMVNKVTSTLFPKYQNLKLKSQNYPFGKSFDPELRTEGLRAGKLKFKTITPEIREIINFAEIDSEELERDIRPTGFYRNKAKNIKAAAKMILTRFNGQLPKTMAEMIQIPGVARKTANIVLGNAYRIVEGIVVDTHVMRLSKRLGLTNQTNPDKIEQDLMKLFDKKDWFTLIYLLIDHGRAICIAKKPKCDECFLNKICPSAFQFPHFKN